MYFCNALFGLMLFGVQNHFSSLSSAASVYCLFAGFSFLNLFIVVRIGTVDRGLRSICESRLFDCGIRQALQNLPDICIDADGLPLNFRRTNRLPLVDTSVGGVRVLSCHLPEGVLDDDRGVMFIAHQLPQAVLNFCESWLFSGCHRSRHRLFR